MQSPYQLFLRLKLEHKEDYLDLQLQKRGFKLVNNTGSGIEQFRNYYYDLEGAPNVCNASIKLMPGKNTTQTISLHLSPEMPPQHIKRLFQNIEEFAKSIPLDLLDLQVRNRIYQKLYEQGKVNAFYVGLSEEEQKEVEQKAFIPIDYKQFMDLQKTNQQKTEEFSISTNTEGQRAPDLDL